MYVYVFACVNMEARERCQKSSTVVCFITLRQGFSLNSQKFTVKSWWLARSQKLNLQMLEL